MCIAYNVFILILKIKFINDTTLFVAPLITVYLK